MAGIVDPRQRRCGLPHCQWCGRNKILIDQHDIAPPNPLMSRMPMTALYLCPICDEVGHGAGPLATILHAAARRVARQQEIDP